MKTKRFFRNLSIMALILSASGFFAQTYKQTILSSGFKGPFGVAVDTSGNIYVADGNSIKKMNVSGGNIHTLGSGFNTAIGVAVDV